MRLVRTSAQETEPFEDLGGGGEFNAGNRATSDEFCTRALELLAGAGASVTKGRHRVGPFEVSAEVAAPDGTRWVVLAHGCIDDGPRAGLRRTDTLKKVGFDVFGLREHTSLQVMVVTSHLPTGGLAAPLLDILVRRLADLVVGVTGDLAGYHQLRAVFGGIPVPLTSTLSPAGPGVDGEQLELFAGPGDNGA